jgi:acylphosphatase
MADAAKHIIFSGRVQGVGFRFTARRIALAFQLTGYVKNLPEGSVEMLAQGNPEDIAGALRDISETFGGYIRDTNIQDLPPNPNLQSFNITF